MRDPQGIIFAVELVVAAAAVFTILVFWMRRQKRRDPSDEETAQHEAALAAKRAELLDAKTHVEVGGGALAPRCLFPGCEKVAERGVLHFLHDEGFRDFVRRRMNAPARLSIVEKKPKRNLLDWNRFEERPSYCLEHHHLRYEWMRSKLVSDEAGRRAEERRREHDLALFERTLDAQIADEVAAHQRASSPKRGRRSEPAPVVRLAPPRGTGTE